MFDTPAFAAILTLWFYVSRFRHRQLHAQVAELVDALASGASGR